MLLKEVFIFKYLLFDLEVKILKLQTALLQTYQKDFFNYSRPEDEEKEINFLKSKRTNHWSIKMILLWFLRFLHYFCIIFQSFITMKMLLFTKRHLPIATIFVPFFTQQYYHWHKKSRFEFLRT